jgi:hypothetical protein
MKSFKLLALICLLAGFGVLRAADGDGPKPKKAAYRTGRAVAAVEAIQRALRDLPPGADLEQIKKALAHIREQIVKDVQGRLSLAKADAEQSSERAVWSERMVKKGYMTRAQAQAERARAEAATLRVQRLQEDLKVLHTEDLPKGDKDR